MRGFFFGPPYSTPLAAVTMNKIQNGYFSLNHDKSGISGKPIINIMD